jgi:hypothetical protein
MSSDLPETIPDVEPGFVAALLAEDELGAVVRSHIYVESRINDYLELVAARPEHLSGLGLRYRQKVQLACVLGFDPDFIKPLGVLGEIRNKFSHKLDTSLTPELVNQLYDALPPFGKQSVGASFTRTKMQLHAEGVTQVSQLQPRDKFILITLTLERVVMAAILLIKRAQGNGS